MFVSTSSSVRIMVTSVDFILLDTNPFYIKKKLKKIKQKSK